MVIELLGVTAMYKGYSNRNTIDSARYVLCQMPPYTPEQDGSAGGEVSSRFIHVVNASDGNHRCMLLDNDTTYVVVKKEATDKIYGGSTASKEGSGADVRFTKISNPSHIAKDKNES